MNKRLTNMIWRSMSESVWLSIVVSGAVIYVMYSNDDMKAFDSWQSGIKFSLSILFIVGLICLIYGFWSSYRVSNRLEQLNAVMLFLEKGNLSHAVQPLGEDEIGRLGEQLNRISTKWEEQVTSLQRLSTNNAELAEKAKYSAVVE